MNKNLLVLNLYTEDFDKILSGEKTIEYRIFGEEYNFSTCQPRQRIMFFELSDEEITNRTINFIIKSVEKIPFEKIPHKEKEHLLSFYRYPWLVTSEEMIAISIEKIRTEK